MILYIITFLVGNFLGVVLMCLLQINKKFLEVLLISSNRTLAKRVNELCRENGVTYEELSCKSEIPFDIILEMVDGVKKIPVCL